MLIVIALLPSVVASAAMTLLYSYDILDGAANFKYPEGSKEFHCFDISTAGEKTYVRGSYGYFAYFEGAVDSNNPLVFNIDWWETLSTSTGLLPQSGSAVLTYQADFSTVEGPYWSGGTSDMLDSYGLWEVQNGTLTANDSTAAGQSQIMEKCLYPGAAAALPRDEIAALNNTIAISGVDGEDEMSLCLMPAGPAVGPWLGSYTYYFGDDDGGTGIEKGTHGINGVSFWGASGMGMASTWHAVTNKYTGVYGPDMHMITATSAGATMAGFWCFMNETTFERTSCYSESYAVVGVNQNTLNCPSFYKYDNSLDPLYTFAAVGSNLVPTLAPVAPPSNDEDDDDDDTVPLAMAVVFGLLSGALMVVVAYQWLALRKLAATGPLSKQGGGQVQL